MSVPRTRENFPRMKDRRKGRSIRRMQAANRRLGSALIQVRLDIGAFSKRVEALRSALRNLGGAA